MVKKSPFGLNTRETLIELFKGKVPPIAGVCMGNDIILSITCPKVLQQIFTDVNKFHTKHENMRAIFSQISPKSILVQATEDKDYLPKRKALSAAFFKKKLSLIIEIVKQVTIGYLSETRH